MIPPSAAVRFHTRCIPRDTLVDGHPVSRAILDNGLCDTFSDSSLRFLKDLGVSVVEARAVWAMLERKRDDWDWSYLQRCREACDRHGLELGLFAWPQHPPHWFLEDCDIPRLRCLEHDRDAWALSYWDPRTADVLGRFYHELAGQFGRSPALVYVGSAGCFGEPQYPQGVSHYHFFANTHNHVGFWCGDSLARRDFARSMIHQHGSLDAVSRAWDRPLNAETDLCLPASIECPRMWIDFARWYTDRLTGFVDTICAAAEAAFPDTPRMMPVGTRGEPLAVGQDKWRIARVAAAHGMACRWTGCGDYEDFARTHVDARRLSSACRLVGCGFGTESALYISLENGLNCIYEQIANGAVVVHDDPGNFRRNREAYATCRPLFRGQPPRTRIACFYSKLQQYFNPGYVDEFYAEQCARLRRRADFEILDEDMITESGLKNLDLLISFGGWVTGAEPCATVRQWVDGGGCLIEHPGGSVSVHGSVQTLGQAASVSPCASLDEALDAVLPRVEAHDGLPWSALRCDGDQGYATAFDDALLLYNAGPTPCTWRISENAYVLAGGTIREVPYAE